MKTGNEIERIISLSQISLRWGLDNWLYASGGLFGGKISSEKNRDSTDLSNRDFRIHPITEKREGVTVRSQQGRVRDDWGNWFGCDNSTLLRRYPVEERYLPRNRFVSAPPTGITLPQSPEDRTLFLRCATFSDSYSLGCRDDRQRFAAWKFIGTRCWEKNITATHSSASR